MTVQGGTRVTTRSTSARRTVRAVICAALVLAAGCSGGSDGSGTGTESTAKERSTTTTTDPDAPPEGAVAGGIQKLRVGECFSPVKGNERAEARAVWKVPCTDPHRYELYARLRYRGPGSGLTGYPGSTVVQNWAEEACFERFEGFVGIPWTRSDLEIQTWWPSYTSWGRPDRTVLCAVTPDDGSTTIGSERASAN
ncbi:MAG: septum formation family protein [Actinomycetes bacterium]